MFCDAKGPFYDWLKSQRRMDDCGHASPVRLAQDYGLLAPNFIAVHANYLAPGDAGLLARSRSHVVHCPRSHDYFAHDPFPYDELRSAGVNVALGTDSLASIRKFDNREPQLDLWAEMRLFSARHPGVPPREILEMAGSRAALALGLEKETGVLMQGFSADCLAKTYTGPVHEKRMVEDLLHTGEVRQVFVAGEIAAPE
jgi:cytosine/adenosine deaminase-related metal-dependent hydrolase